MRALRKIARFLLPYWAQDDEANGAFTYSLAALVDVQLQRMRTGLEQRFPSRSSPSALALTGGDRLIPRGRDETNAHYAARLRAWRYPRGHRVRGSVFALLEQISEYFGGGFELWGVDRSGNRRVRSATGVESFTYDYAWTWDTGAAAQWARQWIVVDGSTVFSEQPEYGAVDLWGGAIGTRGHCIGIGGTSAEAWNAVRRLTQGQHRWLPAGTQGEWLVVSLDGSTPTPDSEWAKWGKIYDGGGIVYYDHARETAGPSVAKPAGGDAITYVALRSALRDYAGDTDWASRTLSELGTLHGLDAVKTIKGDDTDFPLTITMPDGAAYAGAATFPATITLPDDGNLP